MNIVKPYFDDEDWIEINDDYEDRIVITERKSKYKHKITVPFDMNGPEQSEIITWCTENFGRGGRKERWRFGWLDKNYTFYFKQEGDVTLFLLRWV